MSAASLAGLLLYLIMNLNFHFLETNLVSVLIILGLLGAGIGFICRSFKGVLPTPGPEDVTGQKPEP